MQADATAMPFADGRFSGVVCFTMLHHVPSADLQNQLLAEVSRVLRAGGVFAGTDSIGTGRAFRLLHVRDTLVPVAPDGLPPRLEHAGLIEPRVERGGRCFAFARAAPIESRHRQTIPVRTETALVNKGTIETGMGYTRNHRLHINTRRSQRGR